MKSVFIVNGPMGGKFLQVADEAETIACLAYIAGCSHIPPRGKTIEYRAMREYPIDFIGHQNWKADINADFYAEICIDCFLEVEERRAFAAAKEIHDKKWYVRLSRNIKFKERIYGFMHPPMEIPKVEAQDE